MRVQLDIETHDRRLGFDIAGVKNSLTAGTTVEVPGGATVEYRGSIVRKSFGIPEILQLVVDVAKGVEVGLLAAWLYDKVKGKEVEKIIINRRVVTEITADGIRQVLEEEIHSSE
jgi:hypothetical protein